MQCTAYRGGECRCGLHLIGPARVKRLYTARHAQLRVVVVLLRLTHDSLSRRKPVKGDGSAQVMGNPVPPCAQRQRLAYGRGYDKYLALSLNTRHDVPYRDGCGTLFLRRHLTVRRNLHDIAVVR